MQVPTPTQFRVYRAGRREAVQRIVGCVKAEVISLTPWAVRVITRARSEHSASRA